MRKGDPYIAESARYDFSMRLRAVELYEQGHKPNSIISLLGMSLGTMQEWLVVYRSVGSEVLVMIGGKHATYLFETKLSIYRQGGCGRGDDQVRGHGEVRDNLHHLP